MFSWNCLSRRLTGVDCPDVYLEWLVLMFTCDHLHVLLFTWNCLPWCLHGIAWPGVFLGWLVLVLT
jgi:hypothetical protein